MPFSYHRCVGYEKLLFNFILDNPKPLFRAGCSLSPVLNLSFHFVGSVFGRSELHGKLMGKAHSAIAVFFRKVGRRSNFEQRWLSRLIYLRDFILRFWAQGHLLLGAEKKARLYQKRSDLQSSTKLQSSQANSGCMRPELGRVLQ